MHKVDNKSGSARLHELKARLSGSGKGIKCRVAHQTGMARRGLAGMARRGGLIRFRAEAAARASACRMESHRVGVDVVQSRLILRWGRRLGGIFLKEATTKEAGYISGDVRADLIGLEGTAATDLRPAGVGVFGDERLDVVSEGPWIEEGTEIEILQSEGYRHVVREKKGEKPNDNDG